MRTITKTVYTIDELSPEVREKVIKSYQNDHDLIDHVIHDGITAINAFVTNFGLSIKEYEFNPWGRCYVSLNYTHNNFRGLKLKDFKREHMPTGYFIDCILWENFFDEFKDSSSALKAFEHAIESAVDMIKQDMEDQYSMESIIEMIEANEYEFYEDGTIYCDYL